MKIGVLATGDIAVRAAHSLAAEAVVDQVVVVGPARSKNFKVQPDATGCDFLVGSGFDAPRRAQDLGVPLIWDGDQPAAGVRVHGASRRGLVVAMATREPDPQVVGLAHPLEAEGTERPIRFPDPIGTVTVSEILLGGHPLAIGQAGGEFAACLVRSGVRNVTIVDHAGFLDGICLASGVAAADEGRAAWDSALDYLQMATRMGLVMGAA